MKPCQTRAAVGGLIAGGVFAAIAFALPGCTGEARNRHQISGTVTYQGKPVELGMVRFEADASVGNFASACVARINDGKYETKREDSPTDGRYRVVVMGIDVPNVKKVPGLPDDMPAQFPPYTTSLQIPPPEGKFDIEVPAKRSR